MRNAKKKSLIDDFAYPDDINKYIANAEKIKKVEV